MEFKAGANVYTSDGKEAGSLHRVVLDPETKVVTHIVIQRGLLVKGELVIPVEKVASASQEISLNCSGEELKEMPPLEIEHIIPGNEGTNVGKVLGGMNMPRTPDAYAHKETVRTIPEELVALKEGAKVISEDDKHVGDIEQIFTEDGKATSFILTQGKLLKNKKTIPFELVKMVSDDEVDLSIQAQQVEDMPADAGQ